MTDDREQTAPPGRLLMVIHSLRGGGAGRMCVFLANGLSRRGVGVTVAVNMTADEKWRSGFDPAVTLVDLGRGHARRIVCPLVRLVRRERPVTVLAFNYQVAVLLPLVRRLSGVSFRAVGRTVVALSAASRFKGFWQRELVMPLVRRRYRHLDAVIAQSRGMRPDLEDTFRVPPKRIHVIHNPAVPAEGAAVARGVGDAPGMTLLYLGRFKPQKQTLLLLDVLEGLAGRTGSKTVKLVAAGEGPQLGLFLQEVRQRGLEDMVEYLGYVEDLEPLFARADVTVLTSAYEGFPNVLVESIVRGVPVVSFDCPTGPSEIIRDGENGRLVALNDVDAFVDAVAEVLWNPPTEKVVRESAMRFLPNAVLDRYQEVLGV